MKKSKNNNYHTVLDYQKLGDELALRYYSSPEYMRLKDLSKEEIQKEVKQLPFPFCNYFKSNFPEIETLTDHYYDIITADGRPDYRTIEILYLMGASGIHDEEDFVVYNGFKVKFSYDGNDNFIYLGALLELGGNLNSHLLSYIITLAPYEEFPSIKNSYIKLQKFFNETEKNIKHALVSLQNLNLITFSENNNSDLVINLNKDNIVKLQEKHNNYSRLEEDFKINEHYKERIITKTPSCPNCCKEFSKQDIESMLENYEEFIY